MLWTLIIKQYVLCFFYELLSNTPLSVDFLSLWSWVNLPLRPFLTFLVQKLWPKSNKLIN